MPVMMPSRLEDCIKMCVASTVLLNAMFEWPQLYCWLAYFFMPIVKLMNPTVLLDKMYVLFSSTVLLNE